jgi:hypothetical protein
MARWWDLLGDRCTTRSRISWSMSEYRMGSSGRQSHNRIWKLLADSCQRENEGRSIFPLLLPNGPTNKQSLTFWKSCDTLPFDVAVAVQNGFRHRRYRVLTVGAVGRAIIAIIKENKTEIYSTLFIFFDWQQFVKGKPRYIKVSPLHS